MSPCRAEVREPSEFTNRSFTFVYQTPYLVNANYVYETCLRAELADGRIADAAAVTARAGCRGVPRPVTRQRHKRRAAFDRVSVTPLHGWLRYDRYASTRSSPQTEFFVLGLAMEGKPLPEARPRDYPHSIQSTDILRKADALIRERHSTALVPVTRTRPPAHSGADRYLPDWIGRVQEQKALAQRCGSTSRKEASPLKNTSPFHSKSPPKRPLPLPARLPPPLPLPEPPVIVPPSHPPHYVDGAPSCSSLCPCWTHTPSGWHSPWRWCALPTRDEVEQLCRQRLPVVLPSILSFEEFMLTQWDAARVRWDDFYSQWCLYHPHDDAFDEELFAAELEPKSEPRRQQIAPIVVVPYTPLTLEQAPPGREEINRALEVLGYPHGSKVSDAVHRYFVFERAHSARTLTQGLADAIEATRKERIARKSLAFAAGDTRMLNLTVIADDEVAELLAGMSHRSSSSPKKAERPLSPDRFGPIVARPTPLFAAPMPPPSSGLSPEKLVALSRPKQVRPSVNANGPVPRTGQGLSPARKLLRLNAERQSRL